MGIIAWLILGALAGWIVSKIMGTDAQQGWIMNIAVGIAGALIGGFIWGLIKDGEVSLDLNVGSVILAVVGGIILTWLLQFITGRRV